MPYGSVAADKIQGTYNAFSPDSAAFRNRIINGAMVIDQRNAGASVTPTSQQYTLDRWAQFLSQTSKLTIQQNAGSVTPPAGFTNYLGVTSTSAYSVISSDFFNLYQYIEGYNVADLNWGSANAKTVTLSFWVRSSLTGTFGGALQNSANDRSYPYTYTISSANTWEQKSITIAGDTSGTWLTTNGVGLRVFFGLGMGSNLTGPAGAWASAAYYGANGATSVVGTNGATFYITGVQLEVGSTATSFDYRPYGTELQLCQRYYQALSGLGWIQGQANRDTATQSLHGIPYRVSMRGVPTGSVTDSTSNSLNRYGPGGEYYFGENAASVLSLAAYYNNSVTAVCTISGATTFESKAILLGNNATIRLSAEL